jgi:deazaflavin-dependent oxidoreductase (nitroreductase family)
VNFLTPLAIRIGSIPWLPRFLPQITAVDKLIQRVTRGRLTLLRIAGLPNLMLTVKGRKSGVPRTTPLLCVPHGDGQLIAGSNFGGSRPPVWVVNVRAAAERGEPVHVRVHGHSHRAAPREITGAEREQLWAHMVRTWPNYATYAERTDRTIPVFLLEPVAEGGISAAP